MVIQGEPGAVIRGKKVYTFCSHCAMIGIISLVLDEISSSEVVIHLSVSFSDYTSPSIPCCPDHVCFATSTLITSTYLLKLKYLSLISGYFLKFAFLTKLQSSDKGATESFNTRIAEALQLVYVTLNFMDFPSENICGSSYIPLFITR